MPLFWKVIDWISSCSLTVSHPLPSLKFVPFFFFFMPTFVIDLELSFSWIQYEVGLKSQCSQVALF